MWKPPCITKICPLTAMDVPCFPELNYYTVNKMYDKSGKLPIMAMLLANIMATYMYVNTKLYILQYRILRETEYKCHYALVVPEITEVSWYHAPLLFCI